MRPRILITRAPHQASALAESLRALGCEPILIPTIEIAPPTTFAPLDAAIANLDHFHWLIFTSANAVESFHQRLAALKGTGFSPSVDPQEGKGALAPEGMPALPPHLRIASIGPATSRAVEKLLGTKPSLVPPVAVAESLAQALLNLPAHPSSRFFLFPHSESSKNTLEDALNRPEIELASVPAYRNIIPESSVAAIQALFAQPASYPSAITFTSSSTATNLLALLEVSGIPLPSEIPRISIGPVTTQTLHDLHISPHAEATEPTIAALSAEVVKLLEIS